MESLRHVSENSRVSTKSSFTQFHILRHTTGCGGVVLDGLALAVESVVLCAVGLQSPLGLAADGRGGIAGNTGGKHGVGIGGGVEDRWFTVELVTAMLSEVVVKREVRD